MAVVYPTTSGAYSTCTWFDDSTGAAYINLVPQIDDTILLNGKAITVDQNITIVGISNASGTYAIAGGQLTTPNGGYTCILSGDVITSANSTTVFINNSNGHIDFTCRYIIYDININNIGAMSCSTGIGATASITCENLIVQKFANYRPLTVSASGNVTITINETVIPTCKATGVYSLYVTGIGSHIINGNFDGTNSSGNYNPLIYVVPTSETVLNGNIIGCNTLGANAVLNVGASSYKGLTINGTITGGDYGYAVSITASNAILNVIGKITGGKNYALYSNQPTLIINVNDIEAGDFPAIQSTVVCDLNINGNLIFKNWVSPIYAISYKCNSINTQIITMQDENNISRSFSTNLIDVNPANEADVRKDTVYGSSNQFTGSLIVAPKSAVLKDIPTDDGVGTLEQSFNYSAIADIVGNVVANNFP